MPYAIPFVSRHSLTAALLIGLSYASAIAASPTPQPAKGKAPSHARLSQAYGKLPLSFEANRGQTDPSVQFLSHGQGYTLFLRSGEAVLALHRVSPTAPANPRGEPSKDTGDLPTSLLDMQLVGANTRANVAPENRQITKTNYFLGNDPTRWLTDIPNFAKVRYTDVYRGIDLVYYGNRFGDQGQLEYDFIVAPGASPDRIRLRFSEQDALRISPSGDLLIEGRIALRKPDIYQQVDGRRKIVRGSFQLLANNTVAFSVAPFNRSLPLIIDPILVYSTYLGGSGANGNGDQGNGIAVDSTGNAYVVGTTYSTNFPITGEAFQSVNNAASAGYRSTVFVTKFNNDGTALVFSTYLGGSGNSSGGNWGYAIALDSANNAYITGDTFSKDFPVTCGAFQTTYATGFVAKLNATGNALAYSTYLGGSSLDVGQAIAVDAVGDAYVTGYANSTNFPVTEGAFQTQNKGSPNAFVTKLNLGGTALLYSTYLGGNGQDYGNGIAVGASGNAFVAGNTSSTNFPVTSGAFQTALAASTNAFVTELSSTGAEEIYSTFLGGSGGFYPRNGGGGGYSTPGDSAQAIAVDGDGFAYVAGNTGSGDFPTTAGAMESARAGIVFFNDPNFEYGPTTSFVTKLNREGSTLVYSTLLEGMNLSVTGLAVDSAGAVTVTGSANTMNAGDFGGFQSTPDALALPASTGNSAFLVKLDPTAAVLNYATLLGGSSNDGATAVALDSTGNAYVTGFAYSTNFPSTGGAFQAVNEAAPASASNAFVSKFALSEESNQTAYPAGPAGSPTAMMLISDGASCNDIGGFTLSINVSLNSSASGPSPTGTVNFIWGFGGYGGFSQAVPVQGSSGGVSEVSLSYDSSGDTDYALWTAEYLGDSVYLPSNYAGIIDLGFITPCGNFRRSTAKLASEVHASQTQPRSSAVQGKGPSKLPPNPPMGATISATLPFLGPKFTPPLTASPADGEGPQPPVPAQSHGSSVCIAPLPPLSVKLLSNWRIYGAANPTFIYSITGLLNGDTVSVTPQTMATAASQVGSYPITASVTGGAAANYAINVLAGTLSITKAPLYISANSIFSVYGQTPPQPTQYFLSGFVNGDTASVASGAPVLSTTVTSTTLPGFYKIGVQVGTLSAANYYFVTTSAGEGNVEVSKKPLLATANNLTMTQGGPVPPLTYTLSGFVNGDTAANSVTGSPDMYTTATSSSPPGKYLISGTIGTLASQKYSFTRVTGTMTVLP